TPNRGDAYRADRKHRWTIDDRQFVASVAELQANTLLVHEAARQRAWTALRDHLDRRAVDVDAIVHQSEERASLYDDPPLTVREMEPIVVTRELAGGSWCRTEVDVAVREVARILREHSQPGRVPVLEVAKRDV